MRVLIFMLLTVLGTVALADTVIKDKTPDGGEGTISIHDGWARMDSDQSQEYQIWDLNKGVLYAVSPAERRIMEMKPGEHQGAQPGVAVKLEMKKVGKGPKIAGYSTEEYLVMANGKQCGKEYISKRAAKNADIQHLLDNTSKLADLAMMPRAMMGMSNTDPCVLADMDKSDHFKKLGIPLKSIDADGQVDNEIVSIDTKAKLDAKLFALPSDYERTNMQKMMGEAMQQMQQMMQNVPPEAQQYLQQMMQGK